MSKRALVASYYVPQPDLDSSSRRLHHIIRFLVDDGWDVTVAAKNPVRSRRPARRLAQLGIPVYAPIGREVYELIERRQFDIAILAFWYIAELLINDLRRTSPSTRVIVDSMDLHFVRHTRHTFNPAAGDGKKEALDDDYASETMRELNTYGASDTVLAVSNKEAHLINDLMADPILAHAVPDCEDLPPSPFSFDDRRGILFIGNFEHLPNVDAVNYLCGEVVPRLDPDLLAEHPLTIVGNDSGMLLRIASVNQPHVQVVGWVPSVIPYLERTRVALIPLIYGAGTKRKLIQSLMVKTPSVSTTVGIEGLDLAHENQVLVADDPASFAASIERLATDGELWERLATSGREHILGCHGREFASDALLDAIASARRRSPKQITIPVPDWVVSESKLPSPDYQAMVLRLRRIVNQLVPPDAKVSVVSRGDPGLVDLDGRTAWHFPEDERTGQYAGYHPGDSQAAIDHLEAVRAHGAEFLVFPGTEAWWLGHYQEFSELLHNRFERIVHREDSCTIFDLREGVAEPPTVPEALPAATVQQALATPEREVGAATASASTLSSGAGVSVVIPTRDRASLLRSSLESLVEQTLPRDRFEVIVVDDGSTDDTPTVCEELGTELRLRRQRLERSGIAAAKNAGALAAEESILLFFDDDDLADRNLLLEHLIAHQRYPDERLAVLGYTTWAPTLEVTEVMRFVTDVGHYLFSYDGLEEGQELDFTYYWGGRTSCKRDLLLEQGLFRPEFTFGSEDIELAYRLAKHDLRVIYWPRAIQYMNRPITYQEFCDRCERQGRSQWMFSRMHDDSTVQDWCGVTAAEERWDGIAPSLDEKRARAAELERDLEEADESARDRMRRELWDLYWWTFDACKLKGIIEGMRAPSHQAIQQSQEVPA